MTTSPTTPENAERVLWRRNLAARYDVCRETVWRWEKDGKIPAPDVRIGNRRGWRLETIRAHESAAA
ncbi:MAG: transcriptional regulator [Gammaproteobacteria bacterium]|nr:transcriptional regulator [Gammaproteobacteria bacterium]